MKLIRSGLMLMIGGIVLLHTLIPHDHFSKDSEIVILHSHDCSTNLFGDIQISFGLDHGSGHFEHYVEYDNTFNLGLGLPSTSKAMATEFVNSAEFSRAIPIVYHSSSISKVTLRGPPARG